MGATDHESEQRAGTPGYRRAADALRGSALLSLAAAGVLFVLLGYVIQEGVWAAMLGVWGAGMIGIGLLGYALLWARRY